MSNDRLSKSKTPAELAEMTGEPASEFEYDEETPHPEDLDWEDVADEDEDEES